MNKKKIYILFALIFIMTISISNLAFAKAKKKKINSISIRVEGNIELNSTVGDESLEITTKASKYQIESVEAENQSFSWSLYDTPTYKVTLVANEGYVFNVRKASDIKIFGASYISANTENERKNQIIRIKLPAIKDQVFPLNDAYFDIDGVATWKSPVDALYELRLYKGSSLIGDIQKTTNKKFDFREYMQYTGEYYFKVRMLNKDNPDIAGEWTESNRVSLSIDKANENRSWYENNDIGRWYQNDEGKYYYINKDNTLAKNEWKKVKGEWYYFDDKAYMVTGWKEIDNIWYYFDKDSGKMWKNTKTPDGYVLGIDGSMATKN